MIRQELIGTVYTLDVKIDRRRKSSANVTDFSTFDTHTDHYTWEDHGPVRYLIVPTGQKESVISATVYIQVDRHTHKAQLSKLVEEILKQEYFCRVGGVRILHVGRPKLFLRPHPTQHRADTDPEIASERIVDMIFHA